MDMSKLHTAIELVCPIDGVSVGSFTDKSTWIISFRSNATDAQKVSAQSVIDTWNDTPVSYVPVEVILERLGDKASAVWNALTIPQQIRFVRLKEGVASNDVEVRNLLVANGVNPDVILG